MANRITPSSSAGRLRPAALEVRDALIAGRAEVQELHERGLDGLRVCRKLTSQVDRAIGRLYEVALEDLPPADADAIRERVVLVAHGGYGRRHFAPYSDVDLMILHAGRDDAVIAAFARRITQDIYDVGFHLGQSVRTVSHTLQLARQDAMVGTSLLEARHLVGPMPLYDEFANGFSKLVERRASGMAQAFVAARLDERNQYGESVYLLEPNVKRSRGGLRDVHLLRWLWRLKTGVADFDRLRSKGAISKFDHRRLTNAMSFLIRVRNELHFHAQATSDLLTRAEQLRIAEKFEFRGTAGLLPVEQFMRDYFHHTRHISGLSHRLSELLKPTSPVARVLDPMLGRSVAGDFRIGLREISATSAGQARLKARVEPVLELVELARLHDKWIAQDTWYEVYCSAPNYAPEPSPESIEKFSEILDNPLQLGELLRRLHELGVLEKIIPDFARARCLLQFNQYHRYTVDEHCIRAVEEVTRFGDRDDQLGEVYRQLGDKRMLHLALLLHDLGKGLEEDHSVVGERIAQGLADRFGMHSERSSRLMLLVRQHLAMSHLAFRRDTSQQSVINQFVDLVGDTEQLTMLYLITCADLAAVGPGVLNSWKLEVLGQLYRTALDALDAESAELQASRYRAIRDEVLQLLTAEEQADDWYARQLEVLPETFLSSRNPQSAVSTLRGLRAPPSRTGVAWGTYAAESDTVEFVAGVDQGQGRGIFSAMAAALTTQAMEILAAETVVLSAGLLLLRYVVNDTQSDGEPPAARLQTVCDAMLHAIDADEAPRFPAIWGQDQRQADAALSNLTTKVGIETEASDESLVIEVYSIDRRGLLYELARALHDLRLVIRFSKISTHIDQVLDVFYVTERDGQKPTGDARLAAIHARLVEIIAE